MGRHRLAVALCLLLAANAAKGQVKPGMGGMIAIPGAPLPPVSPDAIRTSIKLYEPMLAGVRLLGEPPALARGYGFLATLYASLGNTQKAEKLFDDAEVILERHGATGRDLGWVNNNRGLVYGEQGRYVDALRSFRKAVDVLPSTDATLLQWRVKALQNLGSIEQLVGEVESAQDHYLEGLEILRLLGKEHDPDSYGTRVHLAMLYASIGDFQTARPMLEELEREPRLGHWLRYATLMHLGHTLSGLGEFEGAETRLKAALELTKDETHARLMALMNLAAVYAEAGKFEQGRREGDKALRLAESLDGMDSRNAAAVSVTLGTIAAARGDFVKADNLLSRGARGLSKERGDEEPLAGVLQTLAVVAQRRGQRERALQLSREALDLKEKNLERILAFGSEAQRLAYWNNAYAYDQLANLGDAQLLAEAVLTTKGIVLDSLLAERALARSSRSTEDQERLDRIQALKVELMEEIGRSGTEVERLERAIKKQETAHAKRLARPFARIDSTRIQSALEERQALVEIIRFQLYEEGGKRTPWYGGIVIPSRGQPVWVPLAAAQGIDESITTLVAGLEIGNRGVSTQGRADVVQLLHELHDTLWKPIASALPVGTRYVLLSPDGTTCFVPWAALLDEDETFVAERWQVAQIGAGRDLLRKAAVSPTRTVLALADGTNDLPHARREVEGIASSAQREGWQATTLLDEEASEVELFQHPRPRVLHLATHGGQLDQELASVIEQRLGRNPMYRGYLLLGGADKTREAWQRGSVMPFSEDGILTAEEVGGLDLRDTWLTVLSACRTGAGDAVKGAGVLGLRHGFVLAGTENLMFSLWSVDDAATADFMTAFYERLFHTGDLARAFHDTQCEELLRWKEATQGIPGAVHRAGAFVLTR